MKTRLKHYTRLVYPFAVLILAVLVYLRSSHAFLISPDSYDILLTAKALVTTGTIDVIHLDGYWTALAPFSRYGAAIVIAAVHTVTGVSLITSAKALSMGLFLATWSALLVWALKKYPKKHSEVLLVWSLFVLSFAQLFWVQMIVADMLAAAVFTAGLLLTDLQINRRGRYLGLVIGALVFIRWEIAILLLLIASVRHRYRPSETLLLLMPGVLTYLLFLAATTDSTRYVDYHTARLQEGILLSPLLLILGLVLLVFVFIRFRSNLLHLLLGAALLVPGVLFFEQHDILGTLGNALFLFGHELPLFVLVLVSLFVARKENFETVKLYIGLAGLMVFTYHFYFQHYTIILPLAFIAVVMSLQAAHLHKRQIAFLPVLLVISLLMLVIELPRQAPDSPDIYSSAFGYYSSRQLQPCLTSGTIETSFVPELLFWRFQDRSRIASIGDIATDATIVDREYALRNELSSNQYAKVEIDNSLLVRGQGRYNPWLYIRCGQ
ncbi:MAG: hypothetical protein TR69_WS6001001046 [candidate division WS6 bacterium OLB20]|uniref:Uncharacterized protein n=1 Tax=candidate division WS6 bacterium OLB20 TaxID=1617426 RepID=A0A136LZD7_9BACT|nr:MAG: hypothetical protein TR69_WS6001001046 [candidate division WS6 bacterium OLB20]